MWISSVDMMAGYFGEKLRVNQGFSPGGIEEDEMGTM
jgi:hypothetical protein